jgi:hypothetical protein
MYDDDAYLCRFESLTPSRNSRKVVGVTTRFSNDAAKESKFKTSVFFFFFFFLSDPFIFPPHCELYRPNPKGKSKSDVNMPSDGETYSKIDNVGGNVSEDWDEDEMGIALKNSRLVNTFS